MTSALRRLLVVAIVLTGLGAVATPSSAQQPDPSGPVTTEDPALDQQIDASEPIADGTAVIDRGHVDIGPVVDGGEWSVMIHDDTSDRPVWRPPDDTVLRVGDAAKVVVPDDPTYDFLGAAPGAEVHVVGQTEQPGTVWVGWNTQHPEVMELVDRGITMSMTGVDGPGQMTMYLQSGNFGAPEVLWSSADHGPQPIWVDVNTHTHANWVFSEPGVYLVRLQIEADLLDGTTERTVADVRFAVGDATDPQDALAATGDGLGDPGADAGAGRAATGGTVGDGAVEATVGAGSALIIGAGLVVVFVSGAVAIGMVASRRARRDALVRASFRDRGA